MKRHEIGVLGEVSLTLGVDQSHKDSCQAHITGDLSTVKRKRCIRGEPIGDLKKDIVEDIEFLLTKFLDSNEEE
ncbi:hypothetical protein TNCV_5054841 [Trichonephila clavipes]|nr:hypothetical protein TNCV_5054841 [Trichonephila clavipes]